MSQVKSKRSWIMFLFLWSPMSLAIEPLWNAWDLDEPIYPSFAAVQNSFIPAIEEYNGDPRYICHLGDWTWNYMWTDWFRNASYWWATKNPGARCNHTEVGGQMTIKSRCPTGASAQPQGLCVCPSGTDERAGQCVPRCPEGQFLGAVSGQCKIICPTGTYLAQAGGCNELQPCDTNGSSCPLPPEADPDQGEPCNASGNPINTVTGNKFQAEVDYHWGPDLRFVRYFNSRGATAPGMPRGWSHNFSHRIRVAYRQVYHQPRDVDPDWIGSYIGFVPVVERYILDRPDGSSFGFSPSGQSLDPIAKNVYSFTILSNGFLVQDGLHKENYDAAGKLVRLEKLGSYVVKAHYDTDGRLLRLIDGRGYQIDFGYQQDSRPSTYIRMAAFLDSGVMAGYTLDDLERLTQVRYWNTDMGDGDAIRRYHYDDSADPYRLTGITDENNVRYVSWKYDNEGRAYESTHTGDVDKVTLSFRSMGSDRITDETDVLGAVRSRTFRPLGKTWLQVRNSQPAGAGCNASASELDYDANGNIVRRTDFNGNTTIYVHDAARNLELSRTEASGTAEARTINTVWHTNWRLPTKRSEPGRITEFEYDQHGHATLKKVSDTTVSPVVIRQTSYSYIYNNDPDNPYIKKLTINGPRADSSGADLVVYDYDSRGNLSRMARTVGGLELVTRYEDYDGVGRVGRITTPNQVVTTFKYTARGWLRSRMVSSAVTTPTELVPQITTFSYDYLGQLKKTVFPDQSFIEYVYDGARRLTDIRDNQGNFIHYELDRAGNRLKTTVNDNGGALAGHLNDAESAQAAARVPKPEGGL